MVCLNTGAVMGFVLRQSSGPQLTLDFGAPRLTSPPDGLKANQMVDVVGILDAGDNSFAVPWYGLRARGGALECPGVFRVCS